MTFGDAVKSGFKKYFDFSGRASRSEYWYWILFTVLLSLGSLALDIAFGWGVKPEAGSGPLTTLASIGSWIPSLAVSVRRLHDTNRSAWWVGGVSLGWIGYIFSILLLEGSGANDDAIGVWAIVGGLPLFGVTIALIVFHFLAGTPTANRYGPPVISSGGLRQESKSPTTPAADRWVLSGFDSVGNIVRLEFEVTNYGTKNFVIGRSRDGCDLVIDDQGVSRRHAEIVVTDSGVFIRDLGSSNGTLVNGQKVTNELLRFPVNGILAVGPIELSIFGS